MRRLPAVVACVGLLIAPSAIADPPPGGLVQQGTSAGGQTFRQTARSDPRHELTVELSLPEPSGGDGGGLESFFVRPGRLPLSLESSPGVDDAGEDLVDGSMDHTVRRVVLLLEDGSRRSFVPVPARPTTRRRWPLTRRARFLVVFLPDGPKAVRASAYDGAGRLVARRRLA